MESGLAGTMLGEAHIPTGIHDDRRAAEWRLVQEAQAGDLRAFERLYRENERRVFALCMRLSSNPELAEELTQVVFIRAWRKLGSFRGQSSFSSWLYPLTVNVARSERRSRMRRLAGSSQPTTWRHWSPRRKPPTPEAGFDLEKAMAALPPGARTVFVLHDVEGRTHEEIASLLGLASGTSKAQLHRARRLLREALGS